jgi:hypothetical protein
MDLLYCYDLLQYDSRDSMRMALSLYSFRPLAHCTVLDSGVSYHGHFRQSLYTSLQHAAH